MSCVYPIDAWYSSRLNENGKRPLVFNIRDGYADRPVQVPCGKCVGCSMQRAKIWGVRMYHEASLHERNAFVTLTYANSPGAINKRDLQLFIKRLRSVVAVRYFAVGEYGTLTHRPHYHAVIFGEDFLGGAFSINDELWTNELLQSTWHHGIASVGKVNIETCMYVAGYVTKKAGDKDTFNLMSRRPGIGHNWLHKYNDEIARNGKVCINGRDYGIPKKYLEWYPFEALKNERRAYYSGRTPEQVIQARMALRGREKNYKGKLQLTGSKL